MKKQEAEIRAYIKEFEELLHKDFAKTREQRIILESVFLFAEEDIVYTGSKHCEVLAAFTIRNAVRQVLKSKMYRDTAFLKDTEKWISNQTLSPKEKFTTTEQPLIEASITESKTTDSVNHVLINTHEKENIKKLPRTTKPNFRIKKGFVILFIVILDILILFLYISLGVILFGWKHGGGFLPNIILWGIIVSTNRYLYRKLYKKGIINESGLKEAKEMTDSMLMGGVITDDEGCFSKKDKTEDKYEIINETVEDNELNITEEHEDINRDKTDNVNDDSDTIPPKSAKFARVLLACVVIFIIAIAAFAILDSSSTPVSDSHFSNEEKEMKNGNIISTMRDKIESKASKHIEGESFVKVAENGNKKILLDLSTIREKDGLISTWLVTIHKGETSRNNYVQSFKRILKRYGVEEESFPDFTNYSYTVDQMGIECSSNRMTTMISILYNENGSVIQRVDFDEEDRTWGEVPPHSLISNVKTIICREYSFSLNGKEYKVPSWKLFDFMKSHPESTIMDDINFTPNQIEDSPNKIDIIEKVKSLNENAPLQMDEYTTFVSATFIGSTLNYNFVVPEEVIPHIDEGEYKKLLLHNLIEADVDDAAEYFIENNITITYSILNEDRKLHTIIKITSKELKEALRSKEESSTLEEAPANAVKYVVIIDNEERTIDKEKFENHYIAILKKHPDAQIKATKDGIEGLLPIANYRKAIDEGYKMLEKNN